MEKVRTYLTSSERTAEDLTFNLSLVNALSNYEHNVFFSPRDSLDVGTLKTYLEGDMDSNIVLGYLSSANYLYDMGIALPEADLLIVNANIQVPRNDIRTRYARVLGRRVIGFKTCLETNVKNEMEEINSSPDYLSRQFEFLVLYSIGAEIDQDKIIEGLSRDLDMRGRKGLVFHGGRTPDLSGDPFLRRERERAKELFLNVSDVKDEGQLKKVARRIIERGDRYLVKPELSVVYF